MSTVLSSVEKNSLVEPNWPFFLQCSSIGSLGQSRQDWLESELCTAFSGKLRTVISAPIHVV